jgi:hypothetical protein
MHVCIYIAYVSIRQHTSAYVSIRQHTSAYLLPHALSRLALALQPRHEHLYRPVLRQYLYFCTSKQVLLY